MVIVALSPQMPILYIYFFEAPSYDSVTNSVFSSLLSLPIQHFNQVTRLREYQGVDPHFDTIARQYHDIVKVIPTCSSCSLVIACCEANESPKYHHISLQKLENMQWTIHQVEMDLKRLPEHPST